MHARDVGTLFDHMYRVRDRILAAADHPGVPWVEATPQTIRDLRGTLVHELDVEWSWRVRLQRDDPTSFAPDDEELVPDDFPSVASIRERWSADEAQMRAWLTAMTDEDLEAPCRAEPGHDHPSWHHLLHLYSHAVQQFSDAAAILTRAGHSPGEIDFLDYSLASTAVPETGP